MNKIKSSKILITGDFGLDCNILRRKKSLLFYFVLFTFVFGVCSPSFAQEKQEAQITAPPPMKTISKGEKIKLTAESGIKNHTKLALELMTARLTSAENFSSQQQYTSMFNELGGFHALVDDTLDYLGSHDTDSGKVLNNFKRLEISLRLFAPRLELIRRELPFKYELYVRKLIIYVRQARTKAVEPLFDNSVISDAAPKISNENH